MDTQIVLGDILWRYRLLINPAFENWRSLAALLGYTDHDHLTSRDKKGKLWDAAFHHPKAEVASLPNVSHLYVKYVDSSWARTG